MTTNNQLKDLSWTITIRLLIPILVTWFFVELYSYVDAKGMVAEFTAASSEELAIWQIFYSLVATLYAICVAFLLIKEMQDFAELKTSFKREAFTLQAVSMYLYYLEEDIDGMEGKDKERRISIVFNIKNNLRGYILHLLDYDLCGKSNAESAEERIWDNVKHVSRIVPQDENDNIALQKLMSKLEEIVSIRANRSGWIDTGLSPYLLIFIVFLSLVIVFPFFTFATVNPTINFVSLGTLVFFLCFLLATLIDVGNPYSGHWRVPTDMFEKLLERDFEKLTYVNGTVQTEEIMMT